MTKIIKRGITLGLGLARKRGKLITSIALGLAVALSMVCVCPPANAQVSTSSIATQVDNIGNTIWDILTDIILSKVFLLMVGIILIAFLIRFATGWLRSGGRRA